MQVDDFKIQQFAAPQRIVFGWGAIAKVGELANALGTRALLVTGSRTLEEAGIVEQIEARLDEQGIRHARVARATREPLVADVDAAVAEVKRQGASAGDFILAVGGGSALDLGKAAAALAPDPRPNSVVDYLEGVGKGLKPNHPPLPILAIPTTAGTGSEATKNAVISSTDPPFKKSLRDERLVPRGVLIDPQLAVTVPPNVTAQTGMDAITQLIESYVSKNAWFFPRALCLHGVRLAADSIVAAYQDGGNRPARENLAQAAFLSGVALANMGLGMAHGVAAALGVHCKVPHGLACAVMLPAALRANRAVRLDALAELAKPLTGRSWPTPAAAADAAIDRIVELICALGIPACLSQIGVRAEQLDDLVRDSRGNSMSNNPQTLSDEQLRLILVELL